MLKLLKLSSHPAPNISHVGEYKISPFLQLKSSEWLFCHRLSASSALDGTISFFSSCEDQDSPLQLFSPDVLNSLNKKLLIGNGF